MTTSINPWLLQQSPENLAVRLVASMKAEILMDINDHDYRLKSLRITMMSILERIFEQGNGTQAKQKIKEITSGIISTWSNLERMCIIGFKIGVLDQKGSNRLQQQTILNQRWRQRSSRPMKRNKARGSNLLTCQLQWLKILGENPDVSSGMHSLDPPIQ
ncbi:hypothetical protein HAX54_045640 [Datura stramonium]|uniref:Uncharacterized protein n=1 Tax=Datura stramonium TaxID=4076 RepID=A0ABS8RPH7_DATST|nr:hypothetical protein [Datura stramonium]